MPADPMIRLGVASPCTDKVSSTHLRIGGVNIGDFCCSGLVGERETFSLPSLIAAIVAVAVPDLGDLIALIGAFASSGLAFIFPALLDYLTFSPSLEEWREVFRFQNMWRFFSTVLWAFKDLAIVALGVIGLILGTYASINGIARNIAKHPDEGCTPLWRRH